MLSDDPLHPRVAGQERRGDLPLVVQAAQELEFVSSTSRAVHARTMPRVGATDERNIGARAVCTSLTSTFTSPVDTVRQSLRFIPPYTTNASRSFAASSVGIDRSARLLKMSRLALLASNAANLPAANSCTSSTVVGVPWNDPTARHSKLDTRPQRRSQQEVDIEFHVARAATCCGLGESPLATGSETNKCLFSNL
jgi:hypothetical protein